jgi:hypothetical protein
VYLILRRYSASKLYIAQREAAQREAAEREATEKAAEDAYSDDGFDQAADPVPPLESHGSDLDYGDDFESGTSVAASRDDDAASLGSLEDLFDDDDYGDDFED